MGSTKATHWGYTLNNYTPEELILVRRATTIDPIVEHIHTPERGEGGTPHIQGYLRCSRQVRLTHLKKHWLPRANFTALSSDEYRENMRTYVQKQDATATGATAQQRRAEPMLYPALIPEMIVRWIADNTEDHQDPPSYDTVWRWTRDLTRIQQETMRELASETPELRRIDENEWRWKRVERPIQLATHEAPLVLLVELAKRELVKQHRVETMVDRPEVSKAVRSYFTEILARMEHNRENVHDRETQDVPEEASGQAQAPGSPPEGPDAA